jgi:hypothetical protein
LAILEYKKSGGGGEGKEPLAEGRRRGAWKKISIAAHFRLAMGSRYA